MQHGTLHVLNSHTVHRVSQSFPPCHLNPARTLYYLTNTGIIPTLISAPQNTTLHLYCGFDAQCLWCKVLMAPADSVSEGQRWRAAFVTEGKQTNVKDFSLIQSAVMWTNGFQFDEGGGKPSTTFLTRTWTDVEKEAGNSVRLLSSLCEFLIRSKHGSAAVNDWI